MYDYQVSCASLVLCNSSEVDIFGPAGAVAKAKLKRQSTFYHPLTWLGLHQPDQKAVKCRHFPQPRQRNIYGDAVWLPGEQGKHVTVCVSSLIP